jgi:hypothetical protein
VGFFILKSIPTLTLPNQGGNLIFLKSYLTLALSYCVEPVEPSKSKTATPTLILFYDKIHL